MKKPIKKPKSLRKKRLIAVKKKAKSVVKRSSIINQPIIRDVDFQIDSYVAVPAEIIKTSLTELYNSIGIKKIKNLKYAGSFYDTRRTDYMDFRYFIWFDAEGKRHEIQSNKVTRHSLSFNAKYPAYEIGFNEKGELVSLHSKQYYICYKKGTKLYFIDLRKSQRTWINAPSDTVSRLKVQPIWLSGVEKTK